MDDIHDLVERAAQLAVPARLDAEGLVDRTRRRRRARARVQIAASTTVVVAAVAVGSALQLGHSTEQGAASSPTVPASPSHLVSPSPRSSTSPVLRRSPLIVVPTLRMPTTPSTPKNLPPGLDKVCGRPGSTLTVRILPVVIPYRICDVRGVHVTSGGIEVVVPTKFGNGAGVAAAGSAPPAGSLMELQAQSDARTGDVTISGR